MRSNKFKIRASLSILGIVLATASIGFSSYVIEKDNIDTSCSVDMKTDRAVCYNLKTNVKYTSIEKALETAKSEETIYVYPDLKDTDGNLFSINIGDCTIPEGITLSLPYSGTTVFNDKEHGTLETYTDESGNSRTAYFSDQTIDRVKSLRKTQVVISEGKTLTVKGTLNIGGVLSNPTTGVIGNTAGNYCEITMSSNSKLVCEGGNINCYGYIKRAEKDNGALLNITDSGELMSPFVIYDYKGGNQTVAINNLKYSENITEMFSPFQIFDFCNIQVRTRINYPSVWKTRATIYIATANSYFSAENINFIGPYLDATALILSEGSISVDYEPSVIGITTETPGDAKTTVQISGVVDIGNIKVDISGYEIDTATFFFPISYRFDFIVLNGATLSAAKKVKLMNGSKLKIESGSCLNIKNSLIVYENFVDNGAALAYPYPEGFPDAILENNGTIVVADSGGIGGYISTSTNDAIIEYKTQIYTVSSPEYDKNMPSNEGLSKDFPDVRFIELCPTANTTNDSANINDKAKLAFNKYTSIFINGKFVWLYSEIKDIHSVSIDSVAVFSDTSYGYLTLKAAANPIDATDVTYSFWEFIGDHSNIELETNTGQNIRLLNGSTEAYFATIKVTASDFNGNVVTGTGTFAVPGKIDSTVSGGVNGIKYLICCKNADEEWEKAKEGTITASTNVTTNVDVLSGYNECYVGKKTSYKVLISILPYGRSLTDVEFGYFVSTSSSTYVSVGTNTDKPITYDGNDISSASSISGIKYYKSCGAFVTFSQKSKKPSSYNYYGKLSLKIKYGEAVFPSKNYLIVFNLCLYSSKKI